MGAEDSNSAVLSFLRQHMIITSIIFQFFGIISILLFSWGKSLRSWNLSWFVETIRPHSNNLQKPFKQQLFADLATLKPQGKKRLRILEIGIGSGCNLEYYPQNTELVGVDPNRSFTKYLIENLKQHEGVEWMGYVGEKGESMPNVDSESVDAVVTTNVSCSIDQFAKVIQEIQRVLVPGGKYYFCEHVVDNRKTWARQIQWIFNVTEYWPFITCGCRFRDFESLIKSTGFSQVVGDHFYLDRNYVSFLAPHYHGYAVK